MLVVGEWFPVESATLFLLLIHTLTWSIACRFSRSVKPAQLRADHTTALGLGRCRENIAGVSSPPSAEP
jgi:hypothetical protein